MRKGVLLSLMFVHLTILGSGLFRHQIFVMPKILFEVKNYYQMATGAGASFGFFSPNLGNQFEIRFAIHGDQEIETPLMKMVNAEVALRVSNMSRFFIRNYGSEKIKRATAASLTAAAFNHYPHARKIDFIVDLFNLPLMKDYAQGKRPEHTETYRAEFRKRTKDLYD